MTAPTIHMPVFPAMPYAGERDLEAILNPGLTRVASVSNPLPGSAYQGGGFTVSAGRLDSCVLVR
jgi:hypothetical protein